jgi:hypothetical protein
MSWRFGAEGANLIAFPRIDALDRANANNDLELVPALEHQHLLTGFSSGQDPAQLDTGKLARWPRSPFSRSTRSRMISRRR